jgi:hypothetical protein
MDTYARACEHSTTTPIVKRTYMNDNTSPISQLISAAKLGSNHKKPRKWLPLFVLCPNGTDPADHNRPLKATDFADSTPFTLRSAIMIDGRLKVTNRILLSIAVVDEVLEGNINQDFVNPEF